MLTNAVRYADRVRRPDRRRARRRPPAGARSTPGTSTGSTPRATSSPARRWPRSPTRSPRAAGLDAAGRPAAARRHPPGRRPVRRRPAGRPRHRRGALPRARRARCDRGAGGGPGARWRSRCCASAARPGSAGARWPRPRRCGARLDDELGVIEHARLPVVLPHRRRRRRPDPRHGGAGRGPRLGRRQPGQLPARHLRRRPDPARPADGAVPLAAARGAARHRHRRRVRPAHRGLRADPRTLRRRAGAPASR